MATPPKDGKLLYHLTAIENLEGILSNGLLCRNSIKKFIDIADSKIVDHREEFGLNNFVPFHFFAPSPLHGIVQKSFKNKKFSYITVHRKSAQKKGYKILTQHPLSLEDCTPLDYKVGMEEIDWAIMEKRDYADHECKEVCLAECLAESCVVYTDFFSIIVKNEEDKREVEEIIKKVIGSNEFFYINVQNYIFAK